MNEEDIFGFAFVLILLLLVLPYLFGSSAGLFALAAAFIGLFFLVKGALGIATGKTSAAAWTGIIFLTILIAFDGTKYIIAIAGFATLLVKAVVAALL